ncbi:UNKNOWN [Stylonychia lemnae]|uniref:Cyclin N-terminal domain-containing protein n=1 Tax=Stylonychia lemnae TaxID=5949 RepID=A0A077ZYM1_STYLE|nr:UNKNOWN [Stylonychia lemnae]|eukprot:CDW74712.1 UNKNOWN [Stylonychia lemnae]
MPISLCIKQTVLETQQILENTQKQTAMRKMIDLSRHSFYLVPNPLHKSSQKTKAIQKYQQNYTQLAKIKCKNHQCKLNKLRKFKMIQKIHHQKELALSDSYLSRSIYDQCNKQSQLENSQQRKLDSLKSQIFHIFNLYLRLKKTFNFTLNTIFHAIILFKRFLHQVTLSETKENESFDFNLRDQNQLRLVALTILCLASKYQERVAFKVSELANKIGLLQSVSPATPVDFRLFEFKILAVLDFNLTIVNFYDLIRKMQNQLSQLRILSENQSSKLLDISLHLCLLNLISCTCLNIQFSPQEIAASAVYMAIKLMEKKHPEIRIINRETFNLILQESDCINEQNVLQSAGIILQTFQGALVEFCQYQEIIKEHQSIVSTI